MQAEVDFWDRLLLLESSQSIVYLVTIFHPRREGALLCRTVHDRDLENRREDLPGLPSSSEIYQGCEGRDLEDGGFFGGGEKGRQARRVGTLCQRRKRE
jgi:hypothetical protein